MDKNIVIVESPAKTKTIMKYLDESYVAFATYGHVRDLVARAGAVNTEDNFSMNYEILARSAKRIKDICAAVDGAKRLYLATDPDREGEAIAWHICQILDEKKLLTGKEVYRVVFNEITKRAVRLAFANPRSLSNDLVNAQQARRALDHLVGFNLSPLLWRKIHANLSAGRVQSPALRLLSEREKEIKNFKAREYWTVEALLQKNNDEFSSQLDVVDGVKLKRFDISEQSMAHALKERLLADGKEGAVVSKVEKKMRKRHPAPPFTTSTMQQEAARKLGFPVGFTMKIAQQLYEGVSVDGARVGLITYLRTDAVVMASEAVAEIRDLIAADFGKKNLPEAPRSYQNRTKNAQEAHEAIRPSSVKLRPADLSLDSAQQKLYELIWKRAVASQMESAIYDTVSVSVLCGKDLELKASGSTVREPGFLLLYSEGTDAGEDAAKNNATKNKENKLPPLCEGEKLALKDVAANQHFTEPPPRHTEASLIKTLEKHGIGRPSTYASIITTLLARKYVELAKKKFKLTITGDVVNRFLTEHFERYVDYDFTAKLENELDEIARGEKNWQDVLQAFWSSFAALLKEKNDEVSRNDALLSRELGVDAKSGRALSVRVGRYGPYAQLGTKDDDKKPSFVSLPPSYDMETITFDEALRLMQLPFILGQTAGGEDIAANYGRFGPYLKYGKNNVSLPAGSDPFKVTLDEALAHIEAKEKAISQRVINDFEGIRVLRGRYGPYVTDGKKNATIPKDTDPASLDLDACLKLLEAKTETKKRGSRWGKGRSTRS